MLNYSKKVMKHFLNPRNAGIIKNADAVGRLENEHCGDEMVVYLKIEKKKIKGKEKEYIKNIKFQTLGCPAAIAASDVLCELVKGKTLEEAEKITDMDITKELGGLPGIKIHCSVMGARTLRKAIEEYKKRKASLR